MFAVCAECLAVCGRQCAHVHSAGIPLEAARKRAEVSDTREAYEIQRQCRFQSSTSGVKCEGLTQIADADDIATRNLFDALYVPETQVEGELCHGCDGYSVFFCCVLTWQRCVAEGYDGQEGAGGLGDSDKEGGITALPSLAQSGKAWQLYRFVMGCVNTGVLCNYW